MYTVISLLKTHLVLALALLAGVSFVYAQVVEEPLLPSPAEELMVQEEMSVEAPAEEVATSTQVLATTTEEVVEVSVTDEMSAAATTTQVLTPVVEGSTPSVSEQSEVLPVEESVSEELFPLSPQQCHEEPYLSQFANPGECMRASRGI